MIGSLRGATFWFRSVKASELFPFVFLRISSHITVQPKLKARNFHKSQSALPARQPWSEESTKRTTIATADDKDIGEVFISCSECLLIPHYWS